MAALTYEVGKTYRYRSNPNVNAGGVVFANSDGTFKATDVDEQGDVWTFDCSYNGLSAVDAKHAWCVAVRAQLSTGVVVLVDD